MWGTIAFPGPPRPQSRAFRSRVIHRNKRPATAVAGELRRFFTPPVAGGGASEYRFVVYFCPAARWLIERRFLAGLGNGSTPLASMEVRWPS